MSLYSYLISVEKNKSIFDDEVTRYEYFCIWFLRNVYGARYWYEVVIAQSVCISKLRRYMKTTHGVSYDEMRKVMDAKE